MSGRRVDRLVGIYHANGTLWGEFSYWVKARVGGAHCSLCDITHGSVREKPEWQTCKASLPVPMVTLHLDERDEALAAFTDGRTPCVVAETTEGFVLVVDDAENSVFAWLRKSPGERPVAVLCNMTPAFRAGYRVPLPHEGKWREVLNSDAAEYGGSGKGNLGTVEAKGGVADAVLPPLATVMLEWEG